MSKTFKNVFKLLLLSMVFALGAFLIPEIGLAQDAGLTAAAGQTDLQETSLPALIGRLINIALSFVGVILLIMMIVAGFRWMTAGGDPEKVTKAKKTLINATIGTVLVLASFAISSFVINSIGGAVSEPSSGSGFGSGSGFTSGGGRPGFGGGSSNAFAVSSIRPEGELSIRNVKISIAFSRYVDEESVLGALSVTNSITGAVVAGEIGVAANKVTFVPDAACPSPNEDRKCFDENTPYDVSISNSILSTTGTSLDCSEGPCLGAFTTGELVDVDDPTVIFTAPDSGDRVAPADLVMLQVDAKDDTEIANADFFVATDLYDSVAASGADLSDVLVESVWDTSSFEADQSYRLSVTVSDIAGNEDSDSIQVRINPAHCYNDTQDSDDGETGIDCGGACGACSGGACTENSECSSGSCIEGTCVSMPVITDFSLDNGAPGTYVTITGENFGRLAGLVEFVSADGPIEALIPQCAEGWSDTEVVVEVPEGAVDGIITLTTRTGLVETTEDANGAIVGSFDVNELLHPSICKISPTSGRGGAGVSVIGKNFGDSQDSSKVSFNSTDVLEYTSWSDGSVNVTVPALTDGSHEVKVTVSGDVSNAIEFTSLPAAALSGSGDASGGDDDSTGKVPVIGFVTPESGGIGQYVTITGSNFGGQIGTVRFDSQSSGYSAIGSTAFPDECSERYWSDSEITIIVPENYTNDEALENTTHNLYIVSQDGTQSDAIEFNVTTAEPTPGICAILPENGVAGDSVVIYGSSLGGSEGSATFSSDVAATVDDWSSSEVTVTVPGAASTGPVKLSSAEGTDTNTVNFEIGGEGSEGEAGSIDGAGYGWVFSTGPVAETPQVVIECSDTVISAVPNSRFTGETCIDAQVFAEFTVPMDEATLFDETVIIEECAEPTCTNTEVVLGDLIRSTGAGQTSIKWSPAASYNGGLFKGETLYQVTITTGATSIGGEPLADDVSWRFNTGATDLACEIEKVIVSPNEELLTVKGETTEFSALPATGDCQILDPESFTWTWDINESFASIAEGECSQTESDYCAVAEALAEGETSVVAEEDISNVSGEGLLTIEYTDPYVENYWPNCSEACSNASVGAKFNIGMASSVQEFGITRSIEDPDMVELFECENELCVTYKDTVSNSASCNFEDDGTTCLQIEFDVSGNLKEGAFYRAVIKGDVTSESGVALTRPNFGDDFTWVFRTKSEDAECAISNIIISPDDVTLHAIGDVQPLTVESFGEPDDCSVSGQRLSAYDYDWDWEDPIIDDAEVAAFAKVRGSLLDSNPSGVPDGCTASCLAGGSSSILAICGNGRLEVGEECEDGNITGGDGCSDSCLREGVVVNGQCGDGILDIADSGAGEDCDDGNLLDGDGCSARCLNEGARVIGAICGNGDVAYAPELGGEDCDDGNKKGGDGCSAQCLNEGSKNTVDVKAVCGDGRVDRPYESCDDNNLISGDGCSSICKNEGASDKYERPSVCGDGEVGVGEDAVCERRAFNAEEGCTDACILLGSSTLYNAPSVCGDGVVGVGEYQFCEQGVTADDRVDPVQVAVIQSSAVEHVDIDAGLAVATIRVSSPEFNVSAESNINLSCTAETAYDCPDENAYGVADNRCCMLRPALEVSPAGINVCKNAAIFVEFDAQMEVATLADNIFVELDLSTALNGDCPQSHQTFESTVAQSEGGWIKRLFARVKSFFAPDTSAQEEGACLLPITSYTQRKSDDGMYRISLGHNVLLESFGRYTVNIKGDDLTTTEVEGVITNVGVGILDDKSAEFITSDRFCSLDLVELTDTDPDSPGVYRQAGEDHDFVASTFSLSSGSKQEIEPIEGLYEWDWDSWYEDSAGTFVTVSSELDNEAVVTAAQLSGRAVVVAQATITADTEGISPPIVTTDEEGVVTETAQTVSGKEKVETIICEDPWPNFDNFPFEDSAEGTVLGTTEGIGWMNFSTYYCKNERLKDSNVIAPPEQGSETILKEYIFQIDDGSGDAIGFRVAGNPAYLSPLAWYENQGFSGVPLPVEVDGFSAIQDGRTVYISAPNQIDAGVDPGLRSNIYILSYNAGASEDTVNIFNQMIENMSFAVNVESTGLCHDGVEYTGQSCDSDIECSGGETCGDDKAKLVRDTDRLSDMLTIARAVDSYGLSNGLCSSTTAQVCFADSNCPGTETCEKSVPTLQSGTFVRALNTSKWDSWQANLGAELGIEMPVDPLQHYEGCDQIDPGNFDANTCVDVASGEYKCPNDSYVYHYRSIGLFNYEISAELEYKDSNWLNPIDTFSGLNINVGGNDSDAVSGFTGGDAFCTVEATSYGSSSTCGDGIVGSDEVCELGDKGSNAKCDVNPSDAIFDDGLISTFCKNDCSGFETTDASQCIAFTCGNGVIEQGEACDDGEFNGRYGFCGNQCTYDSAFFCGDGTIAGGEACDCGTDGTGQTIGGRACTVANGAYSTNRLNTCSWDCREAASYCGDGDVDAGETCDSNVDTYDGKLCVPFERRLFGTGRFVTIGGDIACVDNADCRSGLCGSANPDNVRNECPVARLCIDGDQEKVGSICNADSDCNSSGEIDGICSVNTQPTVRTRACDSNGESTNACNWVNPTWAGVDCRGELLCGNGQIDEGESCDDGNDNNTDGCTNTCKENVCGDGFVEKGVEACDEGSGNGELCSASHGSTCSFCSNSCVLLTASGAFCGDGEINGDEFCDAGDIPYSFISSEGDVLTSCPVSSQGSTVTPSNGITYTCKQAGVCNGGIDNGKACTTTFRRGDIGFGATVNTCNGGTCVFPTCANDCASACPFVFKPEATLFTSNLPDANREDGITLASFDSAGGEDVAEEATAGTMHLPICKAGDSMTANVSFDLENDNKYFIFVTDIGWGMKSIIRKEFESISIDGTTRLQIAQGIQKQAIQDIFTEYGDDARIALMTYYTRGTTGINATVQTFCVDSETGLSTEFCDEDNESKLLSIIDGYSVPNNDDTGGTSYLRRYLPNDAMQAAADLFGGFGEGVKKQIIIMPYAASWSFIPPVNGRTSSQANAAKADGIEIFTVAMPSSDTGFENLMASWSSGNPNSENNIDYAYEGDYYEKASGFYTDSNGERQIKYSWYYRTRYSEFYDALLQAAVPARLGFIFNGNLVFQPLREGNNVPIELPGNFVCDPGGETGVPIRTFFTGGGTISLSNVKMNLCKP